MQTIIKRQSPKSGIRLLMIYVIFILLSILNLGVCYAKVLENITNPIQITSETNSIKSFAISADGQYIVFVSDREGQPDLWLGSARPEKVLIPVRLTQDPGVEKSVCFSGDGKYIAYTSSQQDVKGDIFLLSLDQVNFDKPDHFTTTPIRLTDNAYTDDGACFSKDGQSIYFHRIKPGQVSGQICTIDLGNKDHIITPLDTNGDAMFPQISDDGRSLCFVSNRNDINGDIFVLDLKSHTIVPITSGPALDFAPTWSNDGKTLFFSRIGIDTNADQKLDQNDNAVIYRVYPDRGQDQAYPQTMLDQTSFYPIVRGNHLFFLSRSRGIDNCRMLSLPGMIPVQTSAEAQLELGRKISNDISATSELKILAYYKILENFNSDLADCVKAAYAIGRLYSDLAFYRPAISMFEKIGKYYAGLEPQASLAGIEARILKTRLDLDQTIDQGTRDRLIDTTLSDIDNKAADKELMIAGQAIVQSAQFLLDTNAGAKYYLSAISRLDKNILNSNMPADVKARSILIKADLYARIGQSDLVYPLYLKVVGDYQDQSVLADQAVNRIIDYLMTKLPDSDVSKQIKYLRKISHDNQYKLPLLSVAALNRIGDLYYKEDKWPRAKDAYRQVIEKYPAMTLQRTAARLSLAEILYKEERFRQALDLYATEIQIRPKEDEIRQLARQGYIQKSIAAAEYLYSLGEVPAAMNGFREMIDFDPIIVEGHRGYIKCAAALNSMDEVLGRYQRQLEQNPNDPIVIYAIALCLTYKDNKQNYQTARDMLVKAININGQIEYFHQTLGFVLEALESVYHQPGMFEKALQAYKTAYFLNDPRKNPVNQANLLLNLGNSYFTLGQYGQAARFYNQRLDAKQPFPQPETEIQFYSHLGDSAYQVDDKPKAIFAYQKAKGLVDTFIDPEHAIAGIEKIHRWVMDEMLTPILKNPDYKDRADELARSQALIFRKLGNIDRTDIEPPGKSWETYRKDILAILEDQKDLEPEIISLIEDAKLSGFNPQTTRQLFLFRLNSVKQALKNPVRLSDFRAQINDKLGLVYQDSSLWEKAIAQFDTVYNFNQKAGRFKNLAVNMRSKAYNEYMDAGTKSGKEKQLRLMTAASDFVNAMTLVKKYGVAERKSKDNNGLFNIGVAVALDNTTSTQAAHGFSKDQEIRLCEAFISRINLELGKLNEARKALDEQVAVYPPGQKIEDKDAYGVSLLFHRSGLVAAAQERYQDAYFQFRRSAALSIRLQNPVSSAINVMNMAHVLYKAKKDPSEGKALPSATELRQADKQVSKMMQAGKDVLDHFFMANYHNILGAYYVSLANLAQPFLANQSRENQVMVFEQYRWAVSHFMQGLDLLDVKSKDQTRQTYRLMTLLYLNLAVASEKIGESDFANNQLNQALSAAQDGLLPNLTWRALARLGRYDQAYDALKQVTILQAGCKPFEILDGFQNQVHKMIHAGHAEDAFNLVEQLSEWERFNRTAVLFGQFSPEEKRIYASIYPRILRIQDLSDQLVTATGDEKRYLDQRLKDEKALLNQKAGSNFENLSPMIQQISDPYIQKNVVILIGYAAHSEQIADLYAQARQADDRENLKKEYDNLLSRYRSLYQELVSQRKPNASADVLTFLGPESFEAADVMAYLPEKTHLYRLYRFKNSLGENAIAFDLTSEDIRIQSYPDVSMAITSIVANSGPDDYIVYDDPGQLPANRLCALSGTHFIRSVMNKKPFKRILLSIPELKSLANTYDEVALPAGNKTLIETILSKLLVNSHVLAISDPVSMTTNVPTKDGQIADVSMRLDYQNRKLIELRDIVNQPNHLSLAMISKTTPENAYLISHLMSIFGCPTTLVSRSAATKTQSDSAYLTQYASMPGYESVKSQSDRWIYLGFAGMTPDESKAFAKKNFAAYVKEATREFKDKNPVKALGWFENSIWIAKESPDFKPYLLALYQYGRECAYQIGDLPKAQRFAKDLVDFTASTKPDSEAHAEAMLRLGLIYAKQEKYDQALPYLERAVHLLETLALDEKQIIAMAELGTVLENATQYDRALKTFESAASLSDMVDKSSLLAVQYENLGRMYDLRLSQYTMGLSYYKKALAIYQNNQNISKISQSLLNIGRCYRLIGNFNQADRYYQEALDLVKENPDFVDMRSKIVIEQANNAWYQSGYEKALKLERKAFQMAKDRENRLVEIICMNTEGLIWWTLGNNKQALSILEKALELARQQKFRKDEIATTLNNMGVVYREIGQYDRAMQAFDDALAIDTQIQSRWAIAYDNRNKGLTYLRMGQPEPSIPFFQAAVKEAHAIGNRINEAKSILGLAEAYEKVLKSDESRSSYLKAFDLAQQMSMSEVKWRATFGLARLSLSNDPAQAESYLRQSIDIIEKMRADIKIEQLKESFIDNKLDVYENLVSLLVKQDKIVQAFEVAERSRARNFIDLLGNQRLALNRDVDQKLYDRQKNIREHMHEMQMLAAQAVDPNEKQTYEKRLLELNNEYNATLLDIQLKNPQLASFISVTPLKSSELINSLDKDMALLAYYVVEDEILCWVVFPKTQDHPDHNIQLFRTPMGRTSLGQKILDYRRTIQNLEPFEDQSRELYQLLLKKVAPHLTGVKYVGIIPHASLHYLSYATLADQNHFFIDDHALFYLPSASVWTYTLSRRFTEKNHKVLAIGNPDLGNASFDLPFAEREVGTIKWNFPDITILTKERATESWVFNHIGQFGIIHIASHGEFDPINPLFSAIKLTKTDDRDGNLEAAEVFSLKINADLVVLSACQTGLGKVTGGDDVVGLNRAFIYAGTHTIISSLWRVSDVATAILSKTFYRRYKTFNKADSLRQAMLHVKTRYAHPGYWGAFALVGDYQ